MSILGNMFSENNEKSKKDCYDCIYTDVKGSKVKCRFTGENVFDRDDICSRFADSETTNICEDCDYYEFGVFSKFNDHGKCGLTGERRRDNDIACARFCK